jgi:RNA polymerase subunit RPABC4/transcription elongation factor Spt4
MSEKPEKGRCFCPYCDEESDPGDSHFCKPCHVVLRRCVKCLVVIDADVKVCPHCGQAME